MEISSKGNDGLPLADITYVVEDVAVRAATIEQAVLGGENTGASALDNDGESYIRRLKTVHETIVTYERLVEGFQSMIKEYERTIKSFKGAALGRRLVRMRDTSEKSGEEGEDTEPVFSVAEVIAEAEKVEEMSMQLATISNLEKHLNQPEMRNVVTDYSPRLRAVEMSVGNDEARARALHYQVEAVLQEYAAAAAEMSQRLVAWNTALDMQMSELS